MNVTFKSRMSISTQKRVNRHEIKNLVRNYCWKFTLSVLGQIIAKMFLILVKNLSFLYYNNFEHSFTVLYFVYIFYIVFSITYWWLFRDPKFYKYLNLNSVDIFNSQKFQFLLIPQDLINIRSLIIFFYKQSNQNFDLNILIKHLKKNSCK